MSAWPKNPVTEGLWIPDKKITTALGSSAGTSWATRSRPPRVVRVGSSAFRPYCPSSHTSSKATRWFTIGPMISEGMAVRMPRPTTTTTPTASITTFTLPFLAAPPEAAPRLFTKYSQDAPQQAAGSLLAHPCTTLFGSCLDALAAAADRHRPVRFLSTHYGPRTALRCRIRRPQTSRFAAA